MLYTRAENSDVRLFLYSCPYMRYVRNSSRVV